MTRENLLNRNVVPLYFEYDTNIDVLPENRYSIGTGFVIGDMGRYIIVVTAGHVIAEADNIRDGLNGRKRRNLQYLPDDENESNVTELGKDDITCYLLIDEKCNLEVRCCSFLNITTHKKTADTSVLLMEVMDDNYMHATKFKCRLSNPNIGDKVYVHSFKNPITKQVPAVPHATNHKSRTFYQTTKELNADREGSVKNIYLDYWLGPSYEIDIPTDGGNSGGLVYYLDNNIPIACGLVSASASSSTNSNDGVGNTIVSLLHPIFMQSLIIDNIPYIYRNFSFTVEIEHIMDFIILDVIHIVEDVFTFKYIDSKGNVVDHIGFFKRKDSNKYQKFNKSGIINFRYQ